MRLSPALHTLSLILAVIGLARASASQAGGGGPVPETRDLLGAIDFVPTQANLDEVMGPDSLQQLIGLATDDAEDPGVRLRALRALGNYDVDEARGTLVAMIDALSSNGSGTPVLLLRAAMEALAEIGGAAAVPEITPLLDNSSRDVRASAADALRVIGSATAVPALNDRRLIETVPQVQLAISEALRVLIPGG